MVSSIDIAWGAGFLEGEGSFMSRNGRGVRVTCGQKIIEPLERLKKIFGGKIYITKTNFYQWEIGSSPAAGVMMTVFTHMSQRRKGQIQTCLETWKRANFWNRHENAAYLRKLAPRVPPDIEAMLEDA